MIAWGPIVLFLGECRHLVTLFGLFMKERETVDYMKDAWERERKYIS